MMLFLRYFLLVLIIVCSTSIGFLLSKKFQDRVNELNAFLNIINILQNKIKFTKVPLADAFEDLSEINQGSSISEILYLFSRKIKNETCKKAWCEAIEEKRKTLNLKKEDIFEIKKFGNTLGKTDIDGQINETNNFKQILEMQIKKAEDERKKNEKMYRSLGTIAGLAIVIMLF